MSVEMSLEEALETIKSQNQIIVQLAKEKCALQAEIDALMLEFCPDDMTEDQLTHWCECQKVYERR